MRERNPSHVVHSLVIFAEGPAAIRIRPVAALCALLLLLQHGGIQILLSGIQLRAGRLFGLGRAPGRLLGLGRACGRTAARLPLSYRVKNDIAPFRSVIKHERDWVMRWVFFERPLKLNQYFLYMRIWFFIFCCLVKKENNNCKVSTLHIVPKPAS